MSCMSQSFQIVTLHQRFFFAKPIVKMVRVSRVRSPTWLTGSRAYRGVGSRSQGWVWRCGGNVDPVNDRVFGVLFCIESYCGSHWDYPKLSETIALGKLALFLVLARIANQGRVCLRSDGLRNIVSVSYWVFAIFDENDLYKAMDRLSERQERIEKTL